MSTAQEATDGNKRYYKILVSEADIFRRKAEIDEDGAKTRQWTNKDGESGEAVEKTFEALFGTIQTIYFTDSKYGKNLNIELDTDEDGFTPIISLSTDTRSFDDMARKLPNMDFSQEYKFAPYDFVTKDTQKRRVGITVASRGEDEIFSEKVKDFFYDGEKNLHGFPEATEEDKDDWAFFYKKCNKFLMTYLKEQILPKFDAVSQDKPAEVKAFNYPKNELTDEDFAQLEALAGTD